MDKIYNDRSSKSRPLQPHGTCWQTGKEGNVIRLFVDTSILWEMATKTVCGPNEMLLPKNGLHADIDSYPLHHCSQKRICGIALEISVVVGSAPRSRRARRELLAVVLIIYTTRIRCCRHNRTNVTREGDLNHGDKVNLIRRLARGGAFNLFHEPRSLSTCGGEGADPIRDVWSAQVATGGFERIRGRNPKRYSDSAGGAPRFPEHVARDGMSMPRTVCPGFTRSRAGCETAAHGSVCVFLSLSRTLFVELRMGCRTGPLTGDSRRPAKCKHGQKGTGRRPDK